MELATPLHAVTFVVVDLETTGGSPTESRITEVGAVKIRGGEILGEFQSLVDPRSPIPTAITRLTGITSQMVADRPPIEAVLPTFLEFCSGSALVAHNARFDLGFLNANLERLAYPLLDPPVVCTAALARRLVREDVRDVRLATLARHFRCATEPVHRALADARATVEVFHALLERAGSFGVLTLEDLVTFAKVRNTPLFKARRGLADGLPSAPGVYLFRSASGEVLYVGKATNLRARVRSYFGNDDRRKIVALLKETASVDHRICPTPVEAAARELRLITAHRPRFNRRGKESAVYVRLTDERFPRLSVVRAAPAAGSTFLGPVSRVLADRIVDALHQIAPLRRCTDRLGVHTQRPACVLKELGRCLAPCDGTVGQEGYQSAVVAVAAALTGDPTAAVLGLWRQMLRLAGLERYEQAADVRDRVGALVFGVQRGRRMASHGAVEELVASRPATGGHREVVLVRWGRLVASASCPPADLSAAVAELRAHPDRSGTPCSPAEVDLLVRWLEGRGAVVHAAVGALASPRPGGRVLAEHAHLLDRHRRRAGRPDAELAAKRTRRPTPHPPIPQESR